MFAKLCPMARRSATPTAEPQRRSPSQRRSRERVATILDTTAALVVADGVDALSTRRIATAAGVPVASIYQYFADKEEIILELVKRDTEEMDEHVAATVAALGTLSVRSVVTATMRAFLDVYERRKEFVAIYFHGRSNRAVIEFCREHNQRIAENLHAVMWQAGLLTADADLARGRFAVEVGDRILEQAFRDSFTGDQRAIDDGIEMLVGYLERFATDAGRDGISP